ncbi:MAG: translesion DNA synthesis-associated protein ImuA, partial [Pseudomonadales bacterium]|nr:translesion DNA synthesis-associated protein ImuA [Pseudomonadales bacterium]
MDRLDILLQKSGLWRASSTDCGFRPGIPTGFAALNDKLPGNGWPADGITELLYARHGIGEFRLLTPALAHLSRLERRWLLWVAPPFIPYAPALAAAGIELSTILVVRPDNHKDMLWVLEKALGSGSCSAVLAWPEEVAPGQVRRLQVAAREGKSWGIFLRSHQAARQASPAELRIQLGAAIASPFDEHTSINLKILKRRGGWETNWFSIPFGDRLNQITPDFSELIVNKRTTMNRQSLPRRPAHINAGN